MPARSTDRYRRRWAATGCALLLAASLSACGDHKSIVQSHDPVTGGSIDLTLMPAFTGQLTQANLALAAEAPATSASGGLRFPVTGGSVSAGSFAGPINAAGGMRLTNAAGHTTIVSGLSVSRGVVTADIGGAHEKFLSGRVPTVVQHGNDLIWSGSAMTLAGGAASTLNRSLGVSVFTDTVVATMTVTASVPPSSRRKAIPRAPSPAGSGGAPVAIPAPEKVRSAV